MQLRICLCINKISRIKRRNLRVQSSAIKIKREHRRKNPRPIISVKLLSVNVEIERARKESVRGDIQHRIEHRCQPIRARAVCGAGIL